MIFDDIDVPKTMAELFDTDKEYIMVTPEQMLESIPLAKAFAVAAPAIRRVQEAMAARKAEGGGSTDRQVMGLDLGIIRDNTNEKEQAAILKVYLHDMAVRGALYALTHEAPEFPAEAGTVH